MAGTPEGDVSNNVFSWKDNYLELISHSLPLSHTGLTEQRPFTILNEGRDVALLNVQSEVQLKETRNEEFDLAELS